MRCISEVSRILERMERGDGVAAEQLLPLVYEEMRKLAARKLAHEKPGQTLDATGLATKPTWVTVTAYDAYGNIATGYTGTVAFKSSDSSGTLPKNYTFTAADWGMHYFSGLILKRRGTQTIRLTDTLDATLLASLTVKVL